MLLLQALKVKLKFRISKETEITWENLLSVRSKLWQEDVLSKYVFIQCPLFDIHGRILTYEFKVVCNILIEQKYLI